MLVYSPSTNLVGDCGRAGNAEVEDEADMLSIGNLLTWLSLGWRCLGRLQEPWLVLIVKTGNSHVTDLATTLPVEFHRHPNRRPSPVSHLYFTGPPSKPHSFGFHDNDHAILRHPHALSRLHSFNIVTLPLCPSFISDQDHTRGQAPIGLQLNVTIIPLRQQLPYTHLMDTRQAESSRMNGCHQPDRKTLDYRQRECECLRLLLSGAFFNPNIMFLFRKLFPFTVILPLSYCYVSQRNPLLILGSMPLFLISLLSLYGYILFGCGHLLLLFFLIIVAPDTLNSYFY